MRLSSETLGALPTSVHRPGYDRDGRGIGIVHFGIGAFHRAHQAVYTDDVMADSGGDWRILGVSLRSVGVRDQMAPQNGLYSVVEKSSEGEEVRIIGAVADVIVANEAREQLVSTLAAPTTHIASFTITEKGYCRASDGSLDFELADDRSAYAYLAEALSRRRDAGLPGLTLLSCDNLSGNGTQLRRLMIEYLEYEKSDLTSWFTNECSCPSTMVDRIVPATARDDLDEIEAQLGVRDEAAVVTEPFSQWVIEDSFVGPRPSWEKHGAQLTSDVHAFENAKLRMLNGAHSALAYMGLQRGYEFVHQAIADPELYGLIDHLMRDEAASSLTPAAGQDVSSYADALIQRFCNPALNHRLIQIAMDGSQKIPQRWLETLAFHQRQDQQCPVILTAIASWLRHVRGDNGPVDDPIAGALKSVWDTAGAGAIVDAIFADRGLLASDWRPTESDKALIAVGL